MRAQSFLGLLLCMVFLCQCVPLSDPDVVPEQSVLDQQPVTITFGAYESERGLYLPLIDRFNTEQDQVHVQFVGLDDFYNSPQESIGGDAKRIAVSAADTLVSDVRPEDIERQLLLDLRPLMDADATFDRADYYPQAFKQLSTDGGMYVLPQAVSVPLFVYNKDLWNTTSLPGPNASTTWEDLLEAGKRIASPRGSTPTYGLADSADGRIVLQSMLERAGVELFGLPPEQVQLDQPAVVTALERLQQGLRSGAVPTFLSLSTGNGGVSSEDFDKLGRAGRLGIWPFVSFSYDPQATYPFPVGYLPFPDLHQPTHLVYQEGYVISRGTAHPEGAWQWLTFLSRHFVPDEGGPLYVPARRSLATDHFAHQQLAPDLVAALQVWLNRPSQEAFVSPDETVWLAFDDLVRRLNDPQAQPVNVAREAQAAIEQRLAQTIGQAQSTPDTRPIVVATPEILPAGTRRIEFSTPIGEVSVWRKLAAAFAQDHPEIRVHVRSAGSSKYDSTLPELARASDCFLWPTPPATNELSATLDLAPLLDADTAKRSDDIPPALLAPFEYETRVSGLPFTVGLGAIGYNKARFDLAQISPPTTTWILESMRETAQQLTERLVNPAHYGFTLSFAGLNDVSFLLERADVSLRRVVDGRVHVDFTSPQVQNAVQQTIDLLQASAPEDIFAGYQERNVGVRDVILSGQTAMWTTYTTIQMDATQLNTTTPFEPHLVPPPEVAQGGVSTMQIIGMYIAAQTKQPEACWAWLTYLSDHSNNIVAGAFPARRSLIQSAAFRAQIGDEVMAVYDAYVPVLERTNLTPSLLNDPSFEPYWFYQALDRAAHGGNLARALREAQDVTEQYLACMQEKSQRRACATQVDPNYRGLAPWI